MRFPKIYDSGGRKMLKGILCTIGIVFTAISAVFAYLILRKPVKQYSIQEIRSDW